MLDSIQKEFISGRKRTVRDYRKAQAGEQPLFAAVKSVSEHYGVSRKQLWQLSARMAANDNAPVCLTPEKRGAKQPHNKPPKELKRIIIALRNQLGWSSDDIAAVPAEHGGWRDETGGTWCSSDRGIRSLFMRYPVAKQRRGKSTRCEHDNPGDMGHIDIEKLPDIKVQDLKRKSHKIAIIDDHTRICFEERTANKLAETGLLPDSGNIAGSCSRLFLVTTARSSSATAGVAASGTSLKRLWPSMAQTSLHAPIQTPQTNGRIDRFWQICD